MKNFDSRTYSINDFLEWSNNKQLELSPKFQRNSVWSDNAKSYLMDTIINGYPIPKVFIRQKLNIQTKASVREVVDGQQRLRTILSYLRDGFKISRRHNSKYGGLYFSELGNIDDEIQSTILNYEISTDLLVNMADSKVLDVFGRLNSYAVLLNEQEKINSNHFGPFKTLADSIAHSYNDFWIKNHILNSKTVLRMADTTLVADLLIAMIEGIKPKKQIKNYYSQYENEFNHDTDLINSNFNEVMIFINDVFPEGLSSTEFNRSHLFYSLFTAVYHILFGLKISDPNRLAQFEGSYPSFERIRTNLEIINILFGVATEELSTLTKPQVIFLEDSRRATTDMPVRERRTSFIVNLISAK